MKRIILFAALVAAAAPAAKADDLWTTLQPCRSLADGERLSCFDRVLAARDGAPAATPADTPMAAAPAGTVAAAKPAPAPQPAAAADFGSERLKPADDAPPKPEEFIFAKVTAFAVNAFKHFTVTLDNGQVWRQLDSDTPVARVRLNETVRIARGFLDSYTLTIEGVYGTYKVKRVK